MRSTLYSLAAAFALAMTGAALAMGSNDPPAATKAADADFAKAKAMIEAKDYKGALPLLQQVVAKDTKNADAFNLLGFATRKSGDANGSLPYYTQALALDPKHVGAHEYIGEAYLMVGRLPEAEQHLARLETLCVFGCVEHRTLKAAIATLFISLMPKIRMKSGISALAGVERKKSIRNSQERYSGAALPRNTPIGTPSTAAMINACSVRERVCRMFPSTCARTASGLIMRPQSCAHAMRCTRISPLVRFTSTSMPIATKLSLCL